MFITPDTQLEAVRRRNKKRGWGFSDEDLRSPGEPPVRPTDKLSAVVLDVSLDTIQQTFDEAWHFAALAQPKSWRWEEVKSDPEHLSLLDGVPFQRGLRWVKVDFARHWDRENGMRPHDVCDQETSPHSAILWAASYFPRWVRAMDDVNVPFVWIPGYRLKVDGFLCEPRPPNFVWCSACQRVELYMSFADHRCVGWAIPAIVD